MKAAGRNSESNDKKSVLFEDFFTSMLNSITESVFLMTPDGVILVANRTVARRFGFEREDGLIGRNIFELLPPEVAELRRQKASEVVLTGEPLQFEDVRNGRYISNSFYPVLDSEGSVSRLAVFGDDVTERRQAEKSLLLERDRAQEYLDVAGVILLVIDRNGNVTLINRKGCEILGLRHEDVLGKNWIDNFVPESMRARVKRVLARIIGGDLEGVEFYENPVIHANGQERIIAWYNTTLRDSNGNIISLLSSGEDITERKRSEGALRESEAKFRSYVENAPYGVFITDHTGKYVDVNPEAVRITGYRKKELLDMSISDLLPSEELEKGLEHFARLLETGSSVGESPFIHKDGERRYWSISAVRLNEDRFLGFTGDITERKKAEEEQAASFYLLRLAGETARFGGWSVDLSTNIVTWSDTVADIHDMPRGYSPLLEEGIGFYHPEWRERITEFFSNCVQKGIPYDEEMEIVTKKGRRIWVRTIGKAFRDQAGKIVKIQGSFQDIDSPKKAEVVLKNTLERLRRVTGSVIQVIVMAVESRDPYTAGHQRRVGDLARSIAFEMGIAPEEADGIRTAGVIHDLGKISTPAEILSKPRKLNNTEFALVKEHPQKGYEILKDVDFDWPIADMIRQHHERLDGSGYPQGLKGGEISLGARILAVADVVEAMASHRPYRATMGLDAALEEIEKNRGILYDQEVVDAALRLFREKDYRLVDV